MPKFITAKLEQHRQLLLEINIEYFTWISLEMSKVLHTTVDALVGLPIPVYVEKMIDKVCGDLPPNGVFYLLEIGSEIAGMGGMRKVREGVGELKRFYVRPAFRGRKLGEVMLQRIVEDAREFGYETLLLDSAPFMHSAHRLYEKAGFQNCAAYPEVEVPASLHLEWRFMKKAL